MSQADSSTRDEERLFSPGKYVPCLAKYAGEDEKDPNCTHVTQSIVGRNTKSKSLCLNEIGRCWENTGTKGFKKMQNIEINTLPVAEKA